MLASKVKALWPLLVVTAVDTQLWANFEEWGDEQKGTGKRRQGASGDTEGQLVPVTAIPKRVHVFVQVGTEGRDFALHSSIHRTVLRQDPGHGAARGHREVSEHYELLGRLAGSIFFPRLLRVLCRCSRTSFIFRCQGSAAFHLSELS